MIETIHVGNAADTDDKLTVTLCGNAEEIVRVLAKGLAVEDLMKLQEALQTEIEARCDRRSTR